MKPEKKEERRQLLLSAAAEVFSEKGYAGTTISDVAERAKIGKGTVYGYFTSKEDLFFALFQWHCLEMDKAIRLGGDTIGQPATGRLLALGDAIMASLIDMTQTYTLVLEFWAATASSTLQDQFKTEFSKMYTYYRQLVSGIIREGIVLGEFAPGTPAEDLAGGIIAIWDATGLQYWVDPDFNPERAARQSLKALLRGIQARKEL